jgi:hypothetical protein
MKITVSNPSVDNLEKSYLASAFQAGTTALVVRNNNMFSNTKKILIGAMGAERSEIVTVNGAVTPGTNLTVTATLFPHDADDPVYVLQYDKLRIYRSVTGVDGAYDFLVDVVLDMDNPSLSTVYDDISGLTSYYYKVSFYDSVEAIESEMSDPIPSTGYPRGTAGSLVNEFFEEVGDLTQQHMSVEEALNLMNEVNDDMLTQSRRPFRWLKAKATLNTALGNDRIALPVAVYKIDRIQFTEEDGITDRTDNYRIISLAEMEYISNNNLVEWSDSLQYVAIDDTTNEIVLYPTPLTSQVGKMVIYYYAKFDQISAMNQVLQTPNTRIYKLFLLGRFYRKRAIKEPNLIGLSDRFLNDYTGEIVKLQRANRLDVGSPMGMRPDSRHSRGLRRY